jgi:hypothetical protein
MNIKTRIMNLVNRANSERDTLHNKQYGDLNQWMTRQDELEAELNAIDKDAGPGLQIGRCLSFGVGDGYASYIITKIRKNDVVVEWIPLGDGYFSDAVWLSSDRRHHIVNRNTAEVHTRRSPLNPMFG